MLTREEIVRFGIDRREFADTPWIFETGAHSMVRKIAVQRKAGEASFRMIQWRVVCFDSDRFELDFQRPIPANAVLSPRFRYRYGGDKPLGFTLSAKARSGCRAMGPAAEQGVAAAAASICRRPNSPRPRWRRTGGSFRTGKSFRATDWRVRWMLCSAPVRRRKPADRRRQRAGGREVASCIAPIPHHGTHDDYFMQMH